VPDWDPRAWGLWAQALYAIGVVYLLGFFLYFFLVHAAHKRALRGEPAAVSRYNRLLRGFPNAFYAKMCGKRPLAGGPPPPPPPPAT
jgi:hypothetical protein